MDRNGVNNTWTHGLARIGDFTSTGSTKKYRQGARESLLVFRAPETPFEKMVQWEILGTLWAKNMENYGNLWKIEITNHNNSLVKCLQRNERNLQIRGVLVVLWRILSFKPAHLTAGDFRCAQHRWTWNKPPKAHKCMTHKPQPFHNPEDHDVQ